VFIANRRLFLSADRSRVVEENDPDAAFLLATVGDELSDAEAHRLGLLERMPDPDADVEAAAKEKRPAATKVRYPKGTKAQEPPAGQS
jgi:enoyl-CoA hydratase/carnithine racemase